MNYAYADINCRLNITCRLNGKLADESHKFFESMEEMNGILSNVSD